MPVGPVQTISCCFLALLETAICLHQGWFSLVLFFVVF